MIARSGSRSMSPYIHLLITVLYPQDDYALRRYAVSIDANDSRLARFEADCWADPHMKAMLSSILDEAWVRHAHVIVGCEQIADAIQWGPREVAA